MKKILFFLFASVIGLSSCNFYGNKKSVIIETENITQITLNDSVRNSLTRRGNLIARKTQSALQKELGKAIKNGGMAHAIEFCNERAIEISDSLSLGEQIMVKRVALNNRNPNNSMSVKEKKFFNDAVATWNKNHISTPMVGVNEKNQAVYYQTIPMRPVCLSCHGKLESDIMPEVAQRINDVYPEDKAVNFNATDLRGMWVITFPEYTVK
jgi:predicted RNA-binding protein with RPS1 domain